MRVARARGCKRNSLIPPSLPSQPSLKKSTHGTTERWQTRIQLSRPVARGTWDWGDFWPAEGLGILRTRHGATSTPERREGNLGMRCHLRCVALRCVRACAMVCARKADRHRMQWPAVLAEENETALTQVSALGWSALVIRLSRLPGIETRVDIAMAVACARRFSHLRACSVRRLVGRQTWPVRRSQHYFV